MKRFVIALAALVIVAGAPVPAPVAAAEASCCWLYCESYRDLCVHLSRLDGEYCDAWYQGCIDGCQYSKTPQPTF